MGRDFTPEEEHFGGPNATLISYSFWQSRFGGSPDVVGKLLHFQNYTCKIVGIMPRSFQFPDRDVDLWAPSPPDAPFAQRRELTWFNVIGRLKPGVKLDQARADLAAVQSDLGRQYPKTDAKIAIPVTPLKEAAIGGVRESLWLVFGSVSLLLLIACSNTAALLLSRASVRQHELSIRFSLGASRASVAAQLLTEVFILAATGALAGLLIAAGSSRMFRALAKDFPRVEEIGLNTNILLYSFLCVIAVTLLCGIIPVLRSTWRNPEASLAHGGRSQVSARNPIQSLLVGTQIALAVILLTGAGLLLRSLQELGRVSPGFDPQNVITFHISTNWAEAGGPVAKQRTDRILDGLRSIPPVEDVATSMILPGVPDKYSAEFKTSEGRAESEPKMMAEARWVTPEYFATMRIPLLAGEVCRNEGNTVQAMVNRRFAELYLNGQSAIGRHILPANNAFGSPAEIRGIVGDARETGLNHEPPPTVYSCSGSLQPGTVFLIRSKPGSLDSLPGAVRQRVHELEPTRSVYDVAPLTDRISDGYSENRLRTLLLASFALIAVALASVGLYGTLSYLVNVRRREVALRMALGALGSEIVRQYLVQGLRISVFGCAVGLAFATMLARMLSNMLFGVSTTDMATLAGVIAIVLTVSATASLVPAIRASRFEPVQTLREE